MLTHDPRTASQEREAERASRPRPKGRGDMRSIAREHGFLPLRVEGTIPAGLEGLLVRTGPGLYEGFGQRVSHSFEADGALTGIRLRGGRAEGAIRLCRSAGLDAEERAGKPLFGSRAHPLRRLVRSLRRDVKNTGNTSVLAWQERLFALVESSKPLEIDPATLRTIGETDLGGAITAAFSAHPHRVVTRKAVYNFGLDYGPRSKLVLYELPFEGRARTLASIPLSMPVMLHDFAVGPRHAVFFVSPVRIDIPRALLGMRSFGQIIRWEPRRGTEVIVVPLDAPERVTRFTVPAFFQWHFAGLAERGNELVVHYVRYDDLTSFDQLASTGVTQPGYLHEAVVDPISRTVRSEQVWDGPAEFPVLDPRHEGCSYRELVVVSSKEKRAALAHVDLKTRQTRLAVFPEEHVVSEALLVPRGPSAPEGDGWALTLVYDGAIGTSHLAILDTARWEDGPIARCHFETHVPMTFHGSWLPGR